MQSFFLPVLLLVSTVFATPLLEKRYLVTSVVLETATVTVTGSRGWWGWGRTSTVPTATNTVSVVGTITPADPATSTQTDAPSISTAPIVSTSSSSAPPASSTDSTSNPPGGVSTYADPILKQHNLHRSNHSAPPLVWDDRLASIAQEIASSCQYAHNTEAGGGGYGQNIGAGAPDDEIDQMITNQMYNNEMMLYPGYGVEPDMADFESWGHFSQIVWKSTTSVGCYTRHCSSGLGGVSSNVSPYFTVCNYASVGNFAGEYAKNVLEPRGDPIVLL